MAERIQRAGDGGHEMPAGAVLHQEPMIAEAVSGELPFVNRERELATLEGALERAIGGRGRMVLIGGEPGIGKTRLVGELVTLAQTPDRFAQSPRVVVGRCWDSGGAPTLWPWSTVLRQLVSGVEPEVLRRELGAGAGWIAALVPELQGALPELERAPPLDTEQSRFVLFDAITSAVRRATVQRPLLVVLEDVHAADRFSLLALVFLARQIETMPLLLIATHRESEPRRSDRQTSPFARLEREALRLSLPGLAQGEVARLISGRPGGDVPELAGTLLQATGGNPLFIDEAIRLLHARGGHNSLGSRGLVSLSSGVHAVIEQRLDQLGDAAVSTLRVAAITGSRFSLAVVTQASGCERADAAAHLELAISGSIIRPRPEAVGVYEFNHAVIRETVEAGMSTASRAATHYAVGRALERRYAGSLESHLEELAHHFLEAIAAGDPQPALRYAEQAADHAMSLFAHERAARLYAAALEALDLVDELPTEERVRVRARLLLGLGRAYQRLADARAKDVLREAAAAARAANAPDLLAEVALTIGAFALSPGTVDRELVGLLREALNSDIEPTGRLRARLLGRLARALYWERDPEPRRALAEETITVARSTGEPEPLAIALGNSLMATRSIDTTDQALRWIDELLSIPEAPREMIVAARANEIDLLLERGQISAADAALESLARQVERLGDLRAAPYVPMNRARRALMEGRFDEIDALLAQATEAIQWAEDSVLPLIIVGVPVARDLLIGRPELAGDRVRPLIHALPEMQMWRACLVASLAAQGRIEETRQELDRSLAAGMQNIPRDVMWLMTFAMLSQGVVMVGEPGLAREMLSLLAPFAGRNVISPVSGYLGPVDRYLGLLAETLGDRSAAESHLHAAVAIAGRQRAEPMRALAARDLERIEGGGARMPRVETEPAPGSLVLEGEIWSLTLAGRVVRVRDTKGMRQLATLLSAPCREIHALELGGAGPGSRGASGAGEAVASGELAVGDPGAGTGPMLDDAAKAAYRRRVADLEEELEEAGRWNDPERASRVQEELDFITAELSAAVGLGGRDRVAGADAERARVNVTRAVRTAIRRVAEADEQLGAELETTVRTGLFCVYRPDPRRPISWSVEGSGAARGTGRAG